ncbi:MAG: DoxX family protein [Candidatus Nanohaloarchaea archaeon]
MNIEQSAFLVGKILLGGYFAFSGLNHFMQSREMSGWVESKGLPQPQALVYLSGLLLIAGGLTIIAGFYPVIGIIGLAAFLIAVNVTMHDFWNLEEGRQDQMTHFLKNTALLGALLMLVGADWTVYGLGTTLGLI